MLAELDRFIDRSKAKTGRAAVDQGLSCLKGTVSVCVSLNYRKNIRAGSYCFLYLFEIVL